HAQRTSAADSGHPQLREGTPRTRESLLILAAFRPWGGSQDARRARSAASLAGSARRFDTGLALDTVPAAHLSRTVCRDGAPDGSRRRGGAGGCRDEPVDSVTAVVVETTRQPLEHQRDQRVDPQPVLRGDTHHRGFADRFREDVPESEITPQQVLHSPWVTLQRPLPRGSRRTCHGLQYALRGELRRLHRGLDSLTVERADHAARVTDEQ